MKNKIVMVFLDGIGIGPSGDNNPFSKPSMPYLNELTGGPLVTGAQKSNPALLLNAIDAVLGIDGIPQSATGQTSLFTGCNAQQILGYHLPAFPDNKLVALINEHSIFKKLLSQGYSALFANAYSPLYFEKANARRRMHSVTTNLVLSTSIPFRTIDDLRNGKAVYWDITNESMENRHLYNIALLEPHKAGANLARLTYDYDFVLFECFLSDLIGHKCDHQKADTFLRLIDRFIHGITEAMAPHTSLLISSDHGNLEDLSTASHTCNPVPLIVIGPASQKFTAVTRIDQVAPAILSCFN